MTDPLRRDPLEFLRVLKKMANHASWQKTLLFSSKGRQVGYKLGLDHYNTILFSQSMWGRALEIVKTIRNMEEDGVQPNGATYYYICNGMANAEHGFQYDFPTNPMLHRIQHWRVALNALEAAEANGFDTTDTMHNSVIISCTIPTMNHWETGLKVLHKMLDEDRKMHPTMVEHLKACLIRNKRPYEASWLLQKAAEEGVEGYETNSLTSPVYRQLHSDHRAAERTRLTAAMGEANKQIAGSSSSALQEGAAMSAAEAVALEAPKTAAQTTASGMGTSDYYRSLLTQEMADMADAYDDTKAEARYGNVGREAHDAGKKAKARRAADAAYAKEQRQLQLQTNPNALTAEEEEEWQREQDTPDFFSSGLHATEQMSHFRPRVHRQEWYKWHAIANKYRPNTVMRKKQLAPRDSPTGVPGFSRI